MLGVGKSNGISSSWSLGGHTITTTGCEIAPKTGANAAKFFTLATKS